LIPASAVSAVGTVQVAISNPAPGGGSSASQTLNVISANNRIRTLACIIHERMAKAFCGGLKLPKLLAAV
jgi:hypothetical protein